MPAKNTLLMQVDISIVVVSFNTSAVLRECLCSVDREIGSLRAQVIVVDNASTDGSPEMIEREFPEVELIRSQINLGFGPANNLGIKSAKGRYVVLLNSDAFLTDGSLSRSVAHMDNNPRAGLGGCRFIGRDGSWQPSGRKFPTVLGDLIVLSGLAARFPRSRLFGRADRTWANVMEAAEVDWIPGAYSIIRSEVVATIGLFDPRFFLYYEEVDLCMRIKQKGYSIWYWPDVVVVHIGGESARQIRSIEMSRTGGQLILWRMRSMLLYYRKHHGPAARIAMFVEIAWYWMRSQRRRLSQDPNRRLSARTFQSMISLMKQAWRDTGGGRCSPAQPW
jgi:GT2 family glycosyltransferase